MTDRDHASATILWRQAIIWTSDSIWMDRNWTRPLHASPFATIFKDARFCYFARLGQ